MRVSASVHLGASPEEVWRRLTAWEEQARWMRDVEDIRVLSATREGIGAAIAVRTRVLNVPLFTDRLEVTLWDPPLRLAMAHRGLVRGTGDWRLEPEAAGTRFTWTEDVRLSVPVLGELAVLVYRPLLRRVMQRSLAELEALIRRGA
jgi:carbon monoxide dehydrogenase subunit G